MMRESNIPEGEAVITADVPMEVYMRHRHDPIHVIGTFQFRSSHISEAKDKALAYMDVVCNMWRSALDDKTTTRVVVSDSMSNRTLLNVDDIQGISLVAPSQDALEGLLNG